MKRKKFLLVVITIAIVFTICGYSVYNQYYKIDLTPYYLSGLVGYAKSPDEKHSLIITIYRIDKDSDTTYIMGELSTLGENSDATDNKRIFWQKVDTESLDEIVEYDIVFPVVDLNWIDNTTAIINGIVVDVNKGYDYRRN